MSVSSTSRTPSPFSSSIAGGNTSGNIGGSTYSSGETYSRKVFVGGLPPDIDEGMWQYVLYAIVLMTVSLCIYRNYVHKLVIHLVLP